MKTIPLDNSFKTVFKYGYKKHTLISLSLEAIEDEVVLVSCDDISKEVTFAGATLVSFSLDSFVMNGVSLDEAQRAIFATKEGFENYTKMHEYYAEKFGVADGYVSAFCVSWK